MKKCTVKIELLSDTLVGSGMSHGALIDSDIVFDDAGLPYIPAKRIKGCLLDSARTADQMMEVAGINDRITDMIPVIFGNSGMERPAPVFFSNLHVQDYDQLYGEFKILSKKFEHIVNQDSVLKYYTYERQQTKISEEGIAEDHTLRTIRVLKKGFIFYGEIEYDDSVDNQFKKTMSIAGANFRRLGTKRNRGFGEITCTIGNIPSVDQFIK